MTQCSKGKNGISPLLSKKKKKKLKKPNKFEHIFPSEIRPTLQVLFGSPYAPNTQWSSLWNCSTPIFYRTLKLVCHSAFEKNGRYLQKISRYRTKFDLFCGSPGTPEQSRIKVRIHERAEPRPECLLVCTYYEYLGESLNSKLFTKW